MKNVLLKIEYDGTGYNGWQTQKSKLSSLPHRHTTVQETIESVLTEILQEKINIIGSGRTDSGVHAREQPANFKTNSKVSLEKIKRALNSLLPKDIRIKSIKQVPLDFHARYSVKSKTYRYTILNKDYSSVFTRNYAVHVSMPLDVAVMQKESKVLLGKHDFKSFQASDKKLRSSVRTIKKINVKKQNNLIAIDIEADGFLYNMVRNIAGTLIEVGQGKIAKGGLKRILLAKDRKKAGPTAPANGLCLCKVRYL
ncbi:MAG: tRNA pseudouridine(38-40) synthase TruA [PVC group bacterium]|nr:tRNA pseudouridine(38-40) synthase TruA [PVC group bacterium]